MPINLKKNQQSQIKELSFLCSNLCKITRLFIQIHVKIHSDIYTCYSLWEIVLTDDVGLAPVVMLLFPDRRTVVQSDHSSVHTWLADFSHIRLRMSSLPYLSSSHKTPIFPCTRTVTLVTIQQKDWVTHQIR